MAAINEVNKSAMVTFSLDKPYLAEGTMAGAVDIWSLRRISIYTSWISNWMIANCDCSVPCRVASRLMGFLGGGPAGSEEFGLGLIAGGLNDGNIGIWNPVTFVSG